MQKVSLIVSALLVSALNIPGILQAEAQNGIIDGNTVKMHYTLTVDNKVVDDTREGDPLSFIQGEHMILPSLENKLVGLKEGDKHTFIIGPDEGFGAVNEEAIIEVPIDRLPDEGLAVGAILTTTGPNNQPLNAVISDIRENSAILDFNHPLAGKNLSFEVEIIEVA